MTPCPACDTLVDPLRSRFVGVRDGKVVAYCSAECAAGRPRSTTGRAMSPATGVPVRIATPPAGVSSSAGPPDGLGGPVDSGPVIEILHEPASGVVTSAPDRRVELRARHPDEIAIAAFWAADRAARAAQGEPAARRSGARGGHDAAVTARPDLLEHRGDDAAESSEPARGLVAETAGGARGAMAERSRGDSAEASERAQGLVTDTAGGARGTAREHRGGDSAETSERARGLVGDGPGPARGTTAAHKGGDSAESSEQARGLAAEVSAAARGTTAERRGGDSAESSERVRGVAGAAGAARSNTAERRGGVSPEALEPQRAPGLRELPAGTRAARDASGGTRARRSRWPVVVLILVLVGAGAGLLFHFLGGMTGRAPGRATGALRGTPPPIAAVPAARAELSRPVRPSQAAAAPVVDLATAVELARTALRRDLAATSPRVQRLAGVALARTQDPEACELLATQLGLGPAGVRMARTGAEADELAGNDIARLDLAYALARGGDRRGVELLARALGAPRGEARDEAAGLLARLGDRRAVPHLLDLLAVEQRRLGAAERLARLAEPRALQVLDHVRGDPRASADDKARAIVALGAAGRGAVAGALRDMLGDPHFNAFAAAALAAQGDRAARPVLERQLMSPPLRVQAARALRRLDPALDPRPLLPPLLDVVRAGRDIDRIPAAEAILLLAGPAGWSAFD